MRVIPEARARLAQQATQVLRVLVQRRAVPVMQGEQVPQALMEILAQQVLAQQQETPVMRAARALLVLPVIMALLVLVQQRGVLETPGPQVMLALLGLPHQIQIQRQISHTAHL
jgi:hypothetical protein